MVLIRYMICKNFSNSVSCLFSFGILPLVVRVKVKLLSSAPKSLSHPKWTSCICQADHALLGLHVLTSAILYMTQALARSILSLSLSRCQLLWKTSPNLSVPPKAWFSAPSSVLPWPCAHLPHGTSLTALINNRVNLMYPPHSSYHSLKSKLLIVIGIFCYP